MDMTRCLNHNPHPLKGSYSTIMPFTSATSINGLSWLGVDEISSLPSFTSNHAQPLPKRVIPAVENFSLNASNDPNAAVIASPRSPEGVPPAFGARLSQKKLWFQ